MHRHYTGGKLPGTRSRPASVTSTFQIGASAFTRSITARAPANASPRCGALAATITLGSLKRHGARPVLDRDRAEAVARRLLRGDRAELGLGHLHVGLVVELGHLARDALEQHDGTGARVAHRGGACGEVERVRRDADAPHGAVAPAHRRHERHLVARRDARLRVGVLAVDRRHARARSQLHRGEQVGDRGRVGQIHLYPVRARALAQAGEETDGDAHACRLRCGVMEAELTHLDAAGSARMVDVSAKRATERYARARAVVRMSGAAAERVARGDNPKGDVAAVARIAAIQAAKRTDELIPLAHSLPLTHVDPEIVIDAGAGTVTIIAEARCADRTGVEMEAMVACSVGALTVYDMVKGIEPGVVIERIELLDKTGGKSDFHRA